MKCHRIAIIAIAAFAAAPELAAACTQQDAMAKSTQLNQLMQAKMAQDPAQGQALMAKMQPIMMQNQGQMTTGGAPDWDKVCGQYDALIKQAQ
jgi:hypothetical protein